MPKPSVRHDAPRGAYTQILAFLGNPTDVAVLTGDEVPEPYRRLLVHHGHMTLALETFWGGPVAVRVVNWLDDPVYYTRRIYLIRRSTGEPVEYGAVRIDLNLLEPVARDRILEQRTPLGRVLLDHGVLTRVNCDHYLRMTPSAEMRRVFPRCGPEPLYGRLATVDFDGEPAMDLVEVMPTIHAPPPGMATA